MEETIENLFATNPDLLNYVIRGQDERTILDESKKQYLSVVKSLTDIIFRNKTILGTMLVIEDGSYVKYSGRAQNIWKLVLPVDADMAKKLFAIISCDPSLARKSRKRKRDEDEVDVSSSDTILGQGPNGEFDPKNPGKYLVTVSKQHYQNYKSASHSL